MQHITENQQSHARAQQRDAELVNARAALGRGVCCASLKLVSSDAGHMSSGTRMAVRQIAGAKTKVSVVFDALDIDGMNGAASVSTGSGSSPRYDLGLAAVDSQTESGFDFINLGPADGGFDEWVHDGDAFIENQDFGLDEQQPNQSCCGGNNASLSQPRAITVKNDLKHEQNVNNQGQTRENESGSWTELNQIGHLTILPSLQASSSVEGK